MHGTLSQFLTVDESQEKFLETNKIGCMVKDTLSSMDRNNDYIAKAAATKDLSSMLDFNSTQGSTKLRSKDIQHWKRAFNKS